MVGKGEGNLGTRGMGFSDVAKEGRGRGCRSEREGVTRGGRGYGVE